MAWPVDPLDVEVGLFIDGAWVDAVEVGDSVLHRNAITISQGRSNWSSQADPGSAQFTLGNRDGRWSPDNSASPYAGVYRRNIPCRIGIARGETHLRPTDVGADLASTPDIPGVGGGGGSPTAPAFVSVTEDGETSNTTTHTYSLPATVAAGDRLLLVAAAGHESLAATSDLDGWTLVAAGNLYTPWHAFLVYEIEVVDSTLATALSGSTVEFTTAFAVKSSSQVLRTSGARSGGSGTAWAVAVDTATTFSASPNPPSLTAPWGADAHRWYAFAIFGTGGDDVTVYPAGYTSIADTGGATNIQIGSAHLTTSAATQDPGAFTLAGDENWRCLTFVYRAEEDPGDDGVLDISGDIDMRIEFELERDAVDVLHGGPRVRLAHKSSGADGWEWEVFAQGNVFVGNFSWRDSAGAPKNVATLQTGAALPLAFQHEHLALRVTLDVDNGASGHTVTYYTAATLAGPWTQLGSPVVTSGTTSIRTNDAPLRVAGNPADAGHVPLPGRVFGFDLYDGIAGTLVASPRFNSRTPGDTSWTDSAGRVWTIGTGGEISNMLWRFHGELSSLPVRWSVDGVDVYAPVEASGLFRRLRQGNRLVESAIRRAVIRSAANVVQYWPMEDTGGFITSFGAAIGTAALSTSGGVPDTGRSDVFLASAPLPTLGTTALAATVDTYPAATAWQVRWLQSIPDDFTGDGLYFFRVETSDMVWEIEYRDDTGGQFKVWAYRGASVIYQSAWIAFAATGKSWRMTFSVKQNGGNVNATLLGQEQGGTTGGVVLTSVAAGVAGQVQRIRINKDGNVPDWTFGHLTLQSAETPSSELATELNAYTGERAGVRIQRLLREEGIAYRIEGDPTATEAMGPQRPGPLMSLLEDCADTDLGILHESRESVAVAYRTRGSMVDQPVIIDLDYAAGEVAQSPELDRDDQGFANDVTVTNWNGTTARAVLDDGSPLSVSEPPTGAGRYDTSYRVSSLDSRLADLAATRLALTTVDEPRVSKLALGLHHAALVADGALTSTILDSSLGDRVQVSNNLTVALGSATIDQLVQGTREVITSFTHSIDCLTTPRSPWVTDGGGVAPPPGAQAVSFRSQLSLATPGSPQHVLRALGYTGSAAITRADLDDVLDDWVAGTGGTTRNVTSQATWNTAIAAALPGDLIRVTSSFTVGSGQLAARGNLYGISGTTMTASPAGGTADLPIIVTCADGVEVTGSGLTNNVPVLDLVNCRHVWAVGFNVPGTSQFGIRAMNWGGTAGAPAYIAYNSVEGVRDAAIAAQGWFQLITSSGGTPPAGSGNEWGFSEWFVVESNTIVDPNPGEVAGNPGEGIYMGRGGSPGWVSYAKDWWVRGNTVTDYKANGMEAKPGCHRGRFLDNIIHLGRGQNGAPIELCYQFSGINSRPAWVPADIEIYCEGNRIYDYNITETGATRNQLILLGMAGVRIANNLAWSVRDSSGDFGPADDIYGVLIQSELDVADFGNTATAPTWVVNNNFQCRGSINLGADDGAITGVIFRNNITPNGYDGGTHNSTSEDFIATTPAVGSLSDAEWETYGPGSAFDLDPTVDVLPGSGDSIADLDLYIDADITQRPIPATPNPGPFQPAT